MKAPERAAAKGRSHTKPAKYQSSFQNAEFMYTDDNVEYYYIPSMAMNGPFRTEYCTSVNCIYINDDDTYKVREPLAEEEHES